MPAPRRLPRARSRAPRALALARAGLPGRHVGGARPGLCGTGQLSLPRHRPLRHPAAFGTARFGTARFGTGQLGRHHPAARQHEHRLGRGYGPLGRTSVAASVTSATAPQPANLTKGSGSGGSGTGGSAVSAATSAVAPVVSTATGPVAPATSAAPVVAGACAGPGRLHRQWRTDRGRPGRHGLSGRRWGAGPGCFDRHQRADPRVLHQRWRARPGRLRCHWRADPVVSAGTGALGTAGALTPVIPTATGALGL